MPAALGLTNLITVAIRQELQVVAWVVQLFQHKGIDVTNHMHEFDAWGTTIHTSIHPSIPPHLNERVVVKKEASGTPFKRTILPHELANIEIRANPDLRARSVGCGSDSKRR